ncbi:MULTISPECIES: alpha/beta hydrolase family protein [Pseudomonas]|uniref:alpha/beta hydrolase family protein n=1 Tax=Pseudomonas TaxID=286 RepID=UPI0030036157
MRPTAIALPVIGLSLMLSLPALAEDAEPAAPENKASEQAVAPREPLTARSQVEATALERQIDPKQVQHLQAGDEQFLALWLAANSAQPRGVVILIPGDNESADWPQTVGPLRRKLPDNGWHTLSLTLPDPLSTVPIVTPTPEKPAPDAAAETATEDEKAAGQPAEAAVETPAEPSAEADTPAEVANTLDAEELRKQHEQRIFARIGASLEYVRQHKPRTITLLGQGTGAYWAARYISERPAKDIQRIVAISAQAPEFASSQLEALLTENKTATLDVFYRSTAARNKQLHERLMASKRQAESNYEQIALSPLPGNLHDEQEQLYRRVRGWLEK